MKPAATVIASLVLLTTVCAAVTQAGAGVAAEPGMAQLVFGNGGRIISINADGSDRQVLTGEGSVRVNSYAGDSSAKVSPDGSRILLQRRTTKGRKDITTLMSVDRSGGDPQAVLTAIEKPGVLSTFLESAEWSRDGSHIYITRIVQHPKTEVAQLASVRSDGSGIHVIKRVKYSYSSEQGGKRNAPVDAVPSPIDDTLAVTVVSSLNRQGSNLEFVDPSTGKSRLFQRGGYAAAWSPDGSRIAFTSIRNRKNRSCNELGCYSDPQLFVAHLAGGKAKLVGPSIAYSPDWSPDGQRIAFAGQTSQASGGLEIYSVTPGGSCLTWLTNGSPSSATPDWVPGAGSSSPGTCGAKDRPALSEVGPSPKDLTRYPGTLWLGPDYEGVLPSSRDPGGRGFLYDDCGEFRTRDCGPRINIRERQVCKVGDAGTIGTGGYRGLSEVNGGLVLNSASQVLGNYGFFKDVFSILYSGGSAISVHSHGSNPGNEKLSFRTQKKIFRNLRPIGSDTVAPLKPAVLPKRPVRLARKMFRMHSRLGSAGQVYRHTRGSRFTGGVTFEGVRGFIHLGRDLKRIGKVKTVNCNRKRHKPVN